MEDERLTKRSRRPPAARSWSSRVQPPHQPYADPRASLMRPGRGQKYPTAAVAAGQVRSPANGACPDNPSGDYFLEGE
jgi:hypothetical protein